MATIGIDRVNQYVLRKQHLTAASRGGNIESVARDICGLHGTNPLTPYLSLFSRGVITMPAQLDEAMYVRKSLVRIRCMRGTIYVLPYDLLTIAFSALKAPIGNASMGFCKWRGVSEGAYAEVSKQVLAILKGGGLTATEIKRKVETELSISPILVTMCDQGLIVRGAPKGGWMSNKHTYHLTRQYLPDIDLAGQAEPDAISRLLLAYLEAFGPVTETDIAWWTGLSKSNVRNGLADLSGLTSFTRMHGMEGDFIILEDAEKAMLKDTCNRPAGVTLLPTMDGYIMGYKERARYLDDEYYRYVFDRSGNAANTIMYNGRITGVWDVEPGHVPLVKYHLFKTADQHVLKEVRIRAGEIGAFEYGRKVLVEECPSMTPLTDRPAGSVMNPLKAD